MTKETKEVNAKSVKKSDKPIILTADAYKTIILYANRFANAGIPKSQWKEVYGILIGYSDDNCIYVEDAAALTFGHATDVELDYNHYQFIAEIQDKLDAEGKGYYMVGWFHSHPSFDLFFSFTDLKNQLAFQQANPDFCGLVYDHTLLGKKKEEIITSDQGEKHKITKFEVGFEIYRITDVNIPIESREFEKNYHKVEFQIVGLNKFFFANVLAEISARASAGVPLEMAYGEEFEYQEKQNLSRNNQYLYHPDILTEIPKDVGPIFNVGDVYSEDIHDKKIQKKEKIKEVAEELIFEGNQAFKEKDSFTGVEKFKDGIKLYKKIDDYDRVLDLLNQICEKCILNNHFNLAEQFTEELYVLANKKKHLFYRGKANYLRGYFLLKNGSQDDVEKALTIIQDGAVDYVKENDYAGAGMCFHKIGNIFHQKLMNLESSALFYKEAILNYNKAILSQHPLRKSFWSKPESLIHKILDLKSAIMKILPSIENQKLQKKIQAEINNLKYNF